MVGLSLVPTLAGCVIGDNARMLAGDAEFSLYASRTAKNVSKLSDSTNSTNSGTTTSQPQGGGTLTLDPSQLAGLIRAVQHPAPVSRDVPAQPQSERRAIIHIVVAGDTLWDIAVEHGTTVGKLQKRNGIRGSLIHPGQVLVIP